MKKKFLTFLLIILSFLLGNGSMLFGLIQLTIKIGASAALKAFIEDVVDLAVRRFLYGEEETYRSANPSYGMRIPKTRHFGDY